MPEEFKLFSEVIMVILALGTILWRLGVATTTFTLIGQQQAQEIREIKVAMEKLEAAIAAIAIYDVKLTAVIARQDATERRMDERFTRVERMLDELRHGKGLVKES
jgi:hypothetical protein